jgi:hypothetical protein
LRHYERERQRKTTTLLYQGRRTARMRTINPVPCTAREIAVSWMQVQAIVKVLVTINRRAGTDVTR